jgi:hypothetical protein
MAVFLLIVAFFSISPVIGGLFIFLVIIAVFIVIPSLSIIYYPAYFQQASTFESIKKGFSLGFKNWGSTFGTLFIAGLLSGVVSVILQMPLQGYIMFQSISTLNNSSVSIGNNGVLVYALSLLSSLSSVITLPFIFIFLAFQYFSITEKEEGTSLQSKIDEFENL